MISFLHSGNIGDIIYSFGCVLSILKQSKQEKCIFYLKTGEIAYIYDNEPHPAGNTKLSNKFAEQLIPLLKSQNFIADAKIYEGENFDVNLDEFRDLDINQSYGYIARWYFYAFLASYDLSKPWLNVEPSPNTKDCILVNRTFRYRNLAINYKFLRKYNNVAFIGLENEWKTFCEEVPNTKLITCSDFLEMAQLIAGCRLFIGNQSFAYALAEAIKVPRVLEVCPFAPNVIPHGENAWDFYTQPALETIVNNYLKENDV